MLDFAKSIKVGNSKKEDIIKEKKSKGVYLKVDNGQKLEFSDGTTYAKSTGSDDYREVHNYVGNAYTRGQALGGNWFINEAKADGSILVSHHPDGRTLEFSSEYELKDWMRNSHIGNSLFQKTKYDDEIHKLEQEQMDLSRKGTIEALDKIEKLEKEINRLKDLRRKEQGIGNESIESQEDKKFEKLGKDAEKEVGNTDTPEAREKLRDLNEQIKNLEHAKGIAGVDKSNLQKQIDEMHKERAKVQTEIATGNGLDRAFKAMNKKV